MTFLQPVFLWGLIALVVPIIVHFFYLRRTRRYIFTQTRLLEKLIQASRPYLRLNHLILLLLRLLIVGVIVFLFAKPLWNPMGSIKRGKVSALIIIDVSPSMQSQLKGGITFLKSFLAREKDLEEGKVLSTDRLFAEGGFRSIRECIEALDEVRPADMGYELSRILQNTEMHFAGARGERRRVYILSDFQASSVGQIGTFPKGVEYVLLPMPLNISENAYIDSVSFRQAGGQRMLGWRLQGKEGKSYTVRQDNAPAAVVSPGWRETPWPASQAHVTLKIAGDAVSFDNQLWVGILEEERRQWGMSLVGGMGIPAAFGRLGKLLGVDLRQGWSDSVQFGVWVDRLLEDGRWLAWVEKGGVVVVFPPVDLTLSAWSRCFLSRRIELKGATAPQRLVEGLRPFRHEIWEGVFEERPAEGVVPALFQVGQLYQFQAAEAYPLLTTDAGEVLLWEIPWGEGQVYLFTFPWERANFGEQSLFPVLFERLYARRDQKSGLMGAFFLGRPQTFVIAAEEGPVRLRRAEGRFEFIPPQRRVGREIELQIGGYPVPAGLYEVYAGRRRVGYLGANIPPEESSSGAIGSGEWEAAGLETRVVTPEGLLEKERNWGISWRSWHFWALLAVGLLVLEAWWARRLLRAPARLSAPLETVAKLPLQASGNAREQHGKGVE